MFAKIFKSDARQFTLLPNLTLEPLNILNWLTYSKRVITVGFKDQRFAFDLAASKPIRFGSLGSEMAAKSPAFSTAQDFPDFTGGSLHFASN